MSRFRKDYKRRAARLLTQLAAGLAAMNAAAVHGQTNVAAAGTSVDASEVLKMSLGQIFDAGGWVMYPLIVLSLLTVALAVYFFLSIRPSQIGPSDTYEEVGKLLRMGAIEDVTRICEFKPSPLASIVLAGLDHVKGVSEMEPSIVKDVLEGAGAREAERIQGQTQYLLDVAVVAPMLGLLGTVFGMLKAFNGVALDVASAKPVVLAGGVSEALITTAFGLIVGIPAMIFYAYFRRRASLVISGLEAQTVGVFNAICTKRVR